MPENANTSEILTEPIWNRLESSTRGDDFSKSLRAEVRDPLWMLARQWQFGEFEGEDAGSPVKAEYKYRTYEIEVRKETPLEITLEKQPIFYENSYTTLNLEIRLQMANYWLKLIKKISSFIDEKKGLIKNDLLEKFPLILNEITISDNRENQFVEFYKKRSFDGYKFYLAGIDQFDNYDTELYDEKDKIKAIFKKFSKYFNSLYGLPEAEVRKNYWKNDKLEHTEFIQNLNLVGGNHKIKLECNNYYQGHLDWYNFDISEIDEIDAEIGFVEFKKEVVRKDVKQNISLTPTSFKFNGMPEPRFWSFEDGSVNFASVNVDKLELQKIALLEFALIYSNDWFVIPITVDVNTAIQIEGLKITDTFGQKIDIPEVESTDWCFEGLKNNSKSKFNSNNFMFVPDTVSDLQESKKIEEVIFKRDEASNIVWGIETIIPSVLSGGKTGTDISPKQSTPEDKILHYKQEKQLFKNWIPFVAKSVEEENKLRRGAILDENNKKIRPKTSFLRDGLDKDGNLKDLLIPFDFLESEIPKEGIKISKTFKRTRTSTGEVLLWIGIKKEFGANEKGNSLAFDQLVAGNGKK